MNNLPIIYKFDNDILQFIKGYMHNPIMDKAMVAITSLGNLGAIWIVISLFLIMNKKYRKIGIMSIAALLLGSILGEGIIKHIVQRVRPCENIPAANMLITKPLSYSFPSGHTTSSFAAAGIFGKYLKKYALPAFLLAILIAFSRLYLSVHYPTDVIAGIILGIICSKIVIYINDKIYN